jgi:iron(III) transport system permease protein
VLFDHAAAKRAINSFSPSATAAIVIVLLAVPLAYFLVWRRSRLLRVLNLVAEMPYALPGVVLAIAAILVFLNPCRCSAHAVATPSGSSFHWISCAPGWACVR